MYKYSSKEIRDLYNKFQLNRSQKNNLLNNSESQKQYNINILENNNNEKQFNPRETNLLFKQPQNRNVLTSNISTLIGNMPENVIRKKNIEPEEKSFGKEIKLENNYLLRREEKPFEKEPIIYFPKYNDNILHEWEKIIKDLELFRIKKSKELSEIKKLNYEKNNKNNNKNEYDEISKKILKKISSYNKKEIKNYNKINDTFIETKTNVMTKLRKKFKVESKPILKTHNEFRCLKKDYSKGISNNEILINRFNNRICLLTDIICNIDENEEDSDYGDKERKESRIKQEKFNEHYFKHSKNKKKKKRKQIYI